MTGVVDELQRVIDERSLLNHPFYQAWTAGKLPLDSLRSYAAQYYRFVAAFPAFVSGVHSGCDDLGTRQELLENLVEEERGPENHPELWLRFCDALDVPRERARTAPALPETDALVDTYRRLTRQGTTAEGLAALYAYESQVPAVAAAKIDGLRRFYGIHRDGAISFFQLHLTLDEWHSQTCAQLLERHARDVSTHSAAIEAGRRAADALWGFLDGVKRETC